MRFTAKIHLIHNGGKYNMPKGNNRNGNREIRKPKKEKVKVLATASSAPKAIGIGVKSKTSK